MTTTQHRRRSLFLSVAAVVALAGCGSDALVPDNSDSVDEEAPPATDTRTVDPPTVSNLPITQP